MVRHLPDRRFGRGTLVATVALAALSLVSATASAQTAVTTCGQIFSGAGFLPQDLDCTGYDGEIVVPDYVGKIDPPTIRGADVVISRRGSLDLQGHTITGGSFGVVCPKSCEISGVGGTITAQQVHGIVAGTLKIANATVSNAANTGLYVQGNIKMTNTTVSGNEYGTWIPNIIRAVDSIVTNNEEIGLVATRMTLIRSTVTGNGIDVVTDRRPHLKDSTCDTSNSGVCSLD